MFTVPLVLLSELGEVSSLIGSSADPAVFSSTFVSSEEVPPPVPLALRLLFFGSFSSTTVTSLPGSFRRTLADGESSTRFRRTSPSAD